MRILSKLMCGFIPFEQNGSILADSLAVKPNRPFHPCGESNFTPNTVVTPSEKMISIEKFVEANYAEIRDFRNIFSFKEIADFFVRKGVLNQEDAVKLQPEFEKAQLVRKPAQ